MSLPEKNCERCGRRMFWRKKWANNWDAVKYCSEACQRNRLSGIDRQLEAGILALMFSRSTSLCPSEVARSVSPEDWRNHIEATRQAGRRLAARNVLRFQQGGRDVDPSRAKGPVRLVRGPEFPEAES